MEFIVDGTHFTLTADEVRDKLSLHTPDALHQYTVTISGTTWPVKQAFSIATGLTHDRFQSQTARRQLQRLGFKINEGAANGSIQPLTKHQRKKARTFDPESAVESDTVSASVQFTWYSVGGLGVDDLNRPSFPTLPKGPGLYRFSFLEFDAAAKRRVYIGESVNLTSRASQYRNAATDRSRQRTSRRIHKEIMSHLFAGKNIEFSIATEVLLGVDEEILDLHRVSARRFAENAAVLLALLNPNNKVINIDSRFPLEDLVELENDF